MSPELKSGVISYRELCARADRHPYELFLQLEEFEHRKTPVSRRGVERLSSPSTERSWTST